MGVPKAEDPRSVPATNRSLLSVRLMRLEERIVLDAAAPADAGGDGEHGEAPGYAAVPPAATAHDTQADGHAPPTPAAAAAPAPSTDGAQDAVARTIAALLGSSDGDPAAQRIVAISIDVDQADALAGAAADGVAHATFDPHDTTLTGLLQQIRAALDDRPADSIALATHGLADGGFELVDGHAVTLESLGDPALQHFWRGLAALVAPEGRIDLLACDAAAGPRGQALIDTLEHLTGVDFAASTDATGNAAHGGDWVLESDQIAVGALYFDTQRLRAFDHVLDDQPTMTDSNPGQTAIGGHAQGVIVDPNITVTDPNPADFLQGATVRIRAGFHPAEDELTYDAGLAAGLGPIGITGTYDPTTGVLLFKNPATAAEYQQLLRSVRYVNTSDAPDTTPREIFFTIGDSFDAVPAGYNADTGHYYKLQAGPVDWNTARANAAGSNLGGLNGYLATLTSDAEHNAALLLFTGGGVQDAWLGGSDAEAQGAVEGTWYWVTGPEAGTEFWPAPPPGWVTAKWGTGQPDDAGNSDYLILYRGMPPLGPKDWRDEPGAGLHRYLVEYGGLDSDVEGDLTASVMVNVVPPNHAPVLDGSGGLHLAAINEDATSSPGSTVASIIGSAGRDGITDVDGDPDGIALIGIDDAHGTWQFSTDGGATWHNVGDVGADRALLLRDCDRLRFQPDADWHGQVPGGITFHAWDRTEGTAGSYFDATATGGESAFSTATGTASITVHSVNDAPVLDGSLPLHLGTISEDHIDNAGTMIGDLLASLGGDVVTDVDAGASEGIALVGLDASHGLWQFSTDGGLSWHDIGDVSDGHALLLRTSDLLRFQPEADWHGTLDSAIAFRGWDQSAGAAGSYLDATMHGGTSPFSADTGTATLLVDSVNDAPTVAQPLADQVVLTNAEFAHQVAPGAFADVDAGDVLTYSATLADGSPLPSWLTFDAVTRTFSGTPGEGDVGVWTVKVTAQDQHGEFVWDTFILTVDAAPIVAQPLADQTAAAGQPWSYQLAPGAFVDPDPGDTLAYTATLADGSPLPPWLLFDPLTRTFTGTPGLGDIGTLAVKVTADDGRGGSVSDVFTFRVVLGTPTQPGDGGTSGDPPPHTGGGTTGLPGSTGTAPSTGSAVALGDGGPAEPLTGLGLGPGGTVTMVDGGKVEGDGSTTVSAGPADAGEGARTGVSDAVAAGVPVAVAGLGQAGFVADDSGAAARVAAHRDEELLPLLETEHLTTQLQAVIFNGDLLGNADHPVEFHEAWNTILSAYADSGEELAAYLQSAFRTVTESACIYQDSQQALAALRQELALAADAGLHLDVDALLTKLDAAQQDVRLASAQLESAILAAAQAGRDQAFDRVLEDVISAALERLMDANERLFVDSRALSAATTLLREARLDTDVEAPADILAARVSEARAAAHDRIAELRKSWDRVAQDVLAAFVARLASGQTGEAPSIRLP